MEWYLTVIRDNYANFNGRARRKEYWMFNLFHIIIILLLVVFMGVLMAVGDSSGNDSLFVIGISPLVLYVLATALPSMAATVRRLHDVGKSGWWILTPNIPYIGFIFSIYLLVQYCTDGDAMDNQWGPSPKEDEDLSMVFE